MREERFIDLKKCALIVYEQVKNMALVLSCEVRDLHAILGQLCKSE